VRACEHVRNLACAAARHRRAETETVSVCSRAHRREHLAEALDVERTVWSARLAPLDEGFLLSMAWAWLGPPQASAHVRMRVCVCVRRGVRVWVRVAGHAARRSSINALSMIEAFSKF
jgi:hypothetical protein